MDVSCEARKYVPFLRSCEKETPEPITGDVKGHIPSWLQGKLIRVGGGTLQVGPDTYNHIFDGLALLHKFSIQDGQVTYFNKFLRSDVYKKNMEAGRIVVSEFGTKAAPDPCKSIFQRFMSVFSMEELTDNDLVNVVQYSDEFYAHTETNCIWKIDPETLESQKKVTITDYVPVKMATAHTQEGTDGTVYNIGNSFGTNGGYTVIKFPPKQDKSDGAFDRGAVVGKIPFSRYFRPSYYHSFGMSENYFVFVEQPLYLSILYMMFSGYSYDQCMSFTTEKARIHVMRRDDGSLVPVQYMADSFFVFHHINAYEQDGHLVVDMCCYDDGQIVKDLYVKALEENFSKPEAKRKSIFVSRAKRFVLPLEQLLQEKGAAENLVKLPDSKATAQLQTDGTVHCVPEILTADQDYRSEMPRINYAYNGLKYKYFYSIGREDDDEVYSIAKVNVEDGSVQSWSEEGTYVSEPVFVASPDSEEEDDGVVIASLLSRDDEKKVGLVILDAKTMKELARSEFKTECSIPADFHGVFAINK